MSTDLQAVASANAEPSPALRVDEAVKSFDGNVALDGASFCVRPGEWVGLLGPNGAGKTTMMLAIAGLVALDGGSIHVLDRTLGRRPGADARASVGLVPQEIALYPLLTARENLVAFGRLHGVGAADLVGRVAWALDWSGLVERADERVGTFSGGMRRRLNIACGVLHRPRIVLLDEPTVGVDPQARQRIHEMLKRLRDGGASLVQSTHALTEVETVSDRMLIMDRGRIVADGTVPDLVAQHCDAPVQFRMQLDRPMQHLAVGVDTRVEGRELSGTLDDVAAELPPLIEALRASGYRVENLSVDKPGLEHLFERLTGRELRE